MLSQGRNINQQAFGGYDSTRQGMVRVDTCAQTHAGLWSGANDQFLPLKLEVGSFVYFGWLRMNVGVNGQSIIMKDYAFSSIPNQPILAGQTK
jgi:hypothetical protein